MTGQTSLQMVEGNMCAFRQAAARRQMVSQHARPCKMYMAACKIS
eukprot:CAMPEP_0204596246 /NCGR_PEP_ID=MMETSP0661-20131031/53132_1 /ASSEMBLY_ACC=CAM_ASM_000606 /TAXON_ID=109239 /ORGANISM="Alexandrium margalefi, Strain AMGDE01CS-322" /LENGTH=44 /DNA_ID= /DNA_START= /DNA_END= /DNA_ORIENTATION=